MLERQGIRMNQKKLRRLYCEEKLQVRKRGGRKRALGTRRTMVLPGRTNERWSLDFASDAFTDGRRFRILAVVDDYSRECLTLVDRTLVYPEERTSDRIRVNPDTRRTYTPLHLEPPLLLFGKRVLSRDFSQQSRCWHQLLAGWLIRPL